MSEDDGIFDELIVAIGRAKPLTPATLKAELHAAGLCIGHTDGEGEVSSFMDAFAALDHLSPQRKARGLAIRNRKSD